MEELRSLEDLLDLQAEDAEIDRLLHRRQALPELEAYREVHERVAHFDREISAESARLREADLASDKADGELQIAEDKLQREEQRLYAGGLGARGAEHLRQEVEMLRRHVSEHEDQILELMDAKEQAEAEVARLEGERAGFQAEKERLEGLIQQEWRVIDDQIARHEARKQDIVPLIAPGLVTLYEELRAHKEGVAVGRLAEGVCGGCHLKLSAAEQAEVLRASPPRCLHCRRILVPQ
jgi:predicted  nucleic acid-binding Zn-ribbon protein